MDEKDPTFFSNFKKKSYAEKMSEIQYMKQFIDACLIQTQ